jgi:hypothetical protein
MAASPTQSITYDNRFDRLSQPGGRNPGLAGKEMFARGAFRWQTK